MQNIDQSFTLFADIKLNPDILDTGLINIIILVAFLIYALREPLQEILEERRKKIDQEIRNSNSRLKEAERRLKEAQKQYQQVDIAKEKIKKQFTDARQALVNQLILEGQTARNTLERESRQQHKIKSEEIFEKVILKIQKRIYEKLVIRMKNYLQSDKNTRHYMTRALKVLSQEFNKGDF